MKIAVFFLFVFVSAQALGAPHACVVEAPKLAIDETIHVKECLTAAATETESAFQSACEQLPIAQVKYQTEKSTIVFVDRCPMPAQGVCVNGMGDGRSAYYYNRSATEMTVIPPACQNAGGTWKSGRSVRPSP